MTFDVKFYFDLIPSDMKWIAFFSGELNNAATFFSTFRNVSTTGENKAVVINGKLGTGNDCTWKPWTYESCLENAAKVESFKQTLTKYAPSTQRTNKVLNYMSKDLKARQEFVPIRERLVDKAFADSLHNGNNAWQNVHSILLKEACQRAKLSTIPSGCTKVHDLPRDKI